MIDIESMDRDALIAEIRRLRGIDKPNGHRRCKCGDIPLVGVWTYSNSKRDYLAFCPKCSARVGGPVDSESSAWAAWDGVE